MKIKIEKKNEEKYLILLSDETSVRGFFLSKTEIKKLKANLDQMLEYDVQSIGDEI